MSISVQRIPLIFILLTGLAFPVLVNAAPDPDAWTFSETFQGSHENSGSVLKLDSSIGYRFSERFTGGVGAPLYLTHSSSASTTTNGSFAAGLGNVYLTLGYFRDLSELQYSSTITVTAPTGDESKGFSTGRVTVDWNNRLAADLPHGSAFVSLGFANTVSDTAFFVRPFSSLGFVTHMEGGGTLRLAPAVSAGGSAYGVIASGEQTIVNKVNRSGGSSGAGGRRVTNASEANDHGFSGWLDFLAGPSVDLEVGYSRSIAYELNSVFFLLRYTYRP
ncbi:MAG TPA: hypothetical protein VFY29_06080 [Terriglobia bacterium]|nr:hypothetical protein [Terriglobia bacterium]